LDLSGALRLARTEIFRDPFDRESHTNIAVLFTDGTTTNYNAMEDELDLLRNITLIPIGMATIINETTFARLLHLWHIRLLFL